MVFLYFEKNLDKTRVKSLFQSHLVNLHLPLFLLILFRGLSLMIVGMKSVNYAVKSPHEEFFGLVCLR